MTKKKLIYFLLAMALLASCGESSTNTTVKTEDDLAKEIKTEIDSNATQLVKFNNVVFSLPSPYQFAFFIKDLGVKYNKSYLNNTANIKGYTSTFNKAIGMGIYGTDLGYLNIYEQVPDAIQYFSVLKSLSQDLGLDNAFDANTIQRVEANMGVKDSLLHIISNKYREVDAYLKDNDRNNMAVLIIAGGWIESLYILCQVAKENPQEMVMQKVAEQKHPLDNLIKILQPYYKYSDEYSTMIDALVEIAYDFDGVEYTYEYKVPEVMPEQKLTIVKSRSSLLITDEQYQNISEKIFALRASLVNKES